jgi:DNA helicase-2/ATP-dependent DNA helicase PcrA
MQVETKEWLKELNTGQLAAVTHGDGPLLVVAGAGTGKTRTLAYRVSHLLSEGVHPEGVLLLTFTRRAADEMRKRAAGAATSPAAANRVWGGTFHAIANRILRMYAQNAGLAQDFTILDRSDAEDLLDVVRNDMSFSKSNRRFPRKSTCMEIYSRRVSGVEELEPVLKKHFPWCEEWHDQLKAMFRAFTERKLKLNLLDYDDLLLYWDFLVQDQAMAEVVGDRFEHILVDEYQDTNRIQASILSGMRRNRANITVVGDDAQSIYSFRSATVQNMLDFPSQFHGTTIVRLEQNYRSAEPILETANRVITQTSQGYSKRLWSRRQSSQRPMLITCADEEHQSEEVIDRVLEHREQGILLRDQAVLFRAASHSTSLELALSRRNIPFRKYGGLRFLEAAHIKDLVCFLRLAINPRDEVAWFRALQLLLGVGPGTASAAIEHLGQDGFAPTALETFRFPPSAREEAEGLVQLLDDLTTGHQANPSVMIERVRPFYAPILERNHENVAARIADLDHLAQLATGVGSTSDFLADLVLDPPTSTGDLAGPPVLDEDWLVLSTIHSAKGLEWDAVYLIHAADGCLPSDMATGSREEIDEEVRLTYVAMTRARDFLYVLWPMRYFHFPATVSDNHSYAQRCRFLTEDVVQTMDRVGHSRLLPEPDRPSPRTARVDIGVRLQDLWR